MSCQIQSDICGSYTNKGECSHPHCLYTASGTLWMFLHGKLLVMKEMM